MEKKLQKIMARSLSNLLSKLSEEIHEIKCKYRQNDKKYKTCGFKYKYCDCFLENKNYKDVLTK